MSKDKIKAEQSFYSQGNKFRLSFAKVITNIIIFIFSFSCIFPILWILNSSFKTQDEFVRSSISLPSGLKLINYFHVFTQTDMSRYMLNSFRNTVIAAVVIILMSFVVGYFLARFIFIGRNLIYNYFMIGMLIPLHALLVPIYIQFKNIGLIDHWYTLLFPYVAFGLPISVVLVESYVKTIPREFEEAASIDGCSFSRTLFSIIFPLTMPVLATIAIMQFFGVWNEFSFALVLINNNNLWTVPLGLTTFRGQFSTDYPRMMAAIMITMIPVMILYFIFSKNIIKGMTSGAIKG